MRLSGQAEEAEPVQMLSIAPVTSAFEGDEDALPPGPKFWVAWIKDLVQAVSEGSLLNEVMNSLHPELIPLGTRGFPDAWGAAALEY